MRLTENPGRMVDYDLAIIGSGGAGFAAAIRAREAGARVAMIERATLGGTCVNIGCVPSKTLLRAGELYHRAGHHPFAGLHTTGAGVDMSALVGQKDALVQQMRQEKYAALIDHYGWDVIRGEARFIDERTVRVGDRNIKAGSFLIATGASPDVPEIPGLGEAAFLTSATALDLKRVPERLVAIGSGYIALELGQLFSHLGARVTLIQRSPRILKMHEPEISAAVAEMLGDQGIELVTGARFERVESRGGKRRVHVEVAGEKRVYEAEELLVAAGRRPNTGALALDRAAVAVGERGEVVVDACLRTSNPRVYAAGDVTLGPQFVYVAAYEGTLAAENSLGLTERQVDLETVPAVIFTTPAIATVGRTEQQAKDAGHDVKTAVLPLAHVPRARVNQETRGLFKLVADAKTGRLLGAHIVAEDAGDAIYAATLAIEFRLTVEDLKRTMAPYLTMAEGLRLAAQTFDKEVSQLSCCAG